MHIHLKLHLWTLYIALLSIDIWLQLWERNAVTVIRITSQHCVCPSLLKVELLSLLYGRWKNKLNSVPICPGCIVWRESFGEMNKGETTKKNMFFCYFTTKKSISMEKKNPYHFVHVLNGFHTIKNIGIDTKITSLSALVAEILTKTWNHRFRWRPFWKWRHTGSSSQFGDGGTRFSHWGRSQEQIKSGPNLPWGGCTGGALGPRTITVLFRLLSHVKRHRHEGKEG